MRPFLLRSRSSRGRVCPPCAGKASSVASSGTLPTRRITCTKTSWTVAGGSTIKSRQRATPTSWSGTHGCRSPRRTAPRPTRSSQRGKPATARRGSSRPWGSPRPWPSSPWGGSSSGAAGRAAARNTREKACWCADVPAGWPPAGAALAQGRPLSARSPLAASAGSPLWSLSEAPPGGLRATARRRGRGPRRPRRPAAHVRALWSRVFLC
mmetsp:Transcript_113462/g.308174  ORF Transcript_113462/g.308174 Transcript_113462/m.308174 type:complete len:210 (+) Transcript_113462:543-1172(+)